MYKIKEILEKIYKSFFTRKEKKDSMKNQILQMAKLGGRLVL